MSGATEARAAAERAEVDRLRARVAELEGRLTASSRIAAVASDLPLADGGGEAFLRLAFDDGPLGMAILGTDQRVLAANRALEEMLGRPAAELTGRSLGELTHPEDRPAGRHRADLLFRGDIDRFKLERRYLRGDGTAVWAEVTALLLRDRDGRPHSALAAFENVTARHEAEDALRRANVELELRVGERTLSLSRAIDELRREMGKRRRYAEELRRSEAQLFAMIENACDAIWSVDRDFRLVTFNSVFFERYQKVFGREPKHGLAPAALGPAELAEYWVGLYRRALEGETFSDQQRYTLDGRERFYDMSFNPIRTPDGITGVAVFSRDLTDFKEAQEAIEADYHFKAQMLLAHERDRRLTAYEIHDGLVQDITGAKLHLEALRVRCERALGRPEAGFDLILRLLGESIDEGRRLISGLRPPIIDELGIVAALEYLIREPVAQRSLQVDFRHDVQFRRLKPIWEGTLYRIVQEALVNVRKHAGTDRAEVELVQQGDRLRLTIRDRGAGFDVAAASRSRFGLRGIRERARLLEGRAEITSSPGQGTQIVVDLPVVEADPTDLAEREED
jgi:PAS domain S-box-containing protein